MKNQLSAGLFCIAMIFSAGRLPAAEAFVNVSDSFSPSSLQINKGDTVTWVNEDGEFHSIASDDAAWLEKGYLYDEGDTFSVTFNDEGSFGYHDDFTSSTGTITVILSTPPQDIKLDSFQFVNGNFQFQINGLVSGQEYVVQSSTNLVDWSSLSTNVAAAGSVGFTNAAGLDRQFFRVVQ